jgi:hypothetical protein
MAWCLASVGVLVCEMCIVVSVKTVDSVVAVRVVEMCGSLILGGGTREGAQFVEEGANDGGEAAHFNGRRIHAKPQCQRLFAVGAVSARKIRLCTINGTL